MTDFPEWDKLQSFILNGHKPRTVERQLITIARAWLPYPIYWQGGTASARAPWGDGYIWHFAVEVEQERLWNTQEFREGRVFGHDPHPPCRDANPYTYERSRRRSWDCGYILGLSERDEELL